jgi:hypothetical protein
MDSDGDGVGDRLDPDDDNDGVTDEKELLSAISQNFTTLSDALSLVEDTIQGDLDRVNGSIAQTVGGVEGDLLAELRGVNDTLAAEIQAVMVDIGSDLSDLGVSVSADVADLEDWLDEVLAALDSKMNETSTILSSHVGDVDERIAGYYQDLDQSLGEVRLALARLDSNLTSGNEDIQADIATLSEMTANLQEHNLAEVSALLAAIAGDIEELDGAMAAWLGGISENISAFEAGTDADLEDINQTLVDLRKLDFILDELEALDGSLDEAQVQLDRSVRETSDEELSQGNLVVGLTVLVLVLVVIICMLLLWKSRPRDRMEEFLKEEKASEGR